jgi:hypothetical protein
VYQPIELTNTSALVEWPDGFFDQGSDKAHQLLIASAATQRQLEETAVNSGLGCSAQRFRQSDVAVR